MTTLIAGDTLSRTHALADYPASSGWVLHFRLTPRAGGQVIAFDATGSGEEHAVLVAAGVTKDWVPGEYTQTAWVTKAAERYSIASLTDQVTIAPDPALLPAGTDTRTQARKALDDARAALATWNPTRRRYKIGEREMEFNGTADIIKLVTYWEQQVAIEERLAGRTEKISRRIYTRI